MKRAISIRLDDDTLERIDALAEKRDWSRSHWIVRALERVVVAEEKKQ